jgi:hypothetical protein
MSSPANASRPGQSGMNGAPLYPVATMTVVACIGPSVELPAGVDAIHAQAGADLEVVRLGVVLEVREEVVAPHPAPVLTRDAQAREAREKTRRVQAQPVVPLAPCGAGLGPRLEHERREAVAAEQRRRGEARRSGSDDDEV